MTDGHTIGRCGPADVADWATLRDALWPGEGTMARTEQVRGILDGPPDAEAAWIARDAAGRAIGLAEASLRRDYVNGCETSPVGFLEGIYVDPAARRQGVARRLCAAAEAWARSLGCTEFASDAAADAVGSQHMHRALGFEETERVVYFRKALAERG